MDTDIISAHELEIGDTVLLRDGMIAQITGLKESVEGHLALSLYFQDAVEVALMPPDSKAASVVTGAAH